MINKKHKFIEMFTDIDDKYIADAKPMAQKPIELRPETRRTTAVWKKITAAAACLAVLGGGSAVAVKLMNSQSGVGTSNSSLNSPFSPNSAGNSSDLENSSAYLLNTPDIEYGGTLYEVVRAANFDGVKMSVAFRQKEYGRGSFVQGVIAIENTTDTPITLVSNDGASDWVDVDFGSLVERFKSEFTGGGIIQPGETYYQTLFYDTCTQEFENDFDRYHGYKTTNLVDAGRYSGTAVLKYLSDVNDPSGETIEHTMDFSIDIGNYNVGDSIGGYVKEGSVDEYLKKWGPDTFTIREDFPGVTFECDFRSIHLINEDGSRTKLFGGRHIGNYCISDFNNDGYGDIIACVMLDHGIYETGCIFAYDHKNKQLYAAADLDNYNIGEYVEKEGYSERGRIMLSVTANGNDPDPARFFEPFTSDVLKPCSLNRNGEPVFEEEYHYIDALRHEYEIGDEFEYEGESYTVIHHSCTPDDFTKKDGIVTVKDEIVVGARRGVANGVDTVEFVAFYQNTDTKPVGLMNSTSSPDETILFKFVPDDGNINTSALFYDSSDIIKMAYIAQPGETVYQKASLPIDEGKYILSISCHMTDPDKFDASKTYMDNCNKTRILSLLYADLSVSSDNVAELFKMS